MDEPGDPLARGLDVLERDVQVAASAVGHRARSMGAGHARLRHGRHHLRVCASTDIVSHVLDYLPVSAESDRERYAAVGRALADPKRLCVLESLAIGELSVSDLSTRVGCQVPNMSQHLAVLRRRVW